MTRLLEYIQELNEGVLDKGIFKACFMSGTAACFDVDTMVKTSLGYKKISEVEEGDIVLTFNENSGMNEWNEVEEKFEYDVDKQILELEFENGEKVICTEDHKFFMNGEWIKAKDL